MESKEETDNPPKEVKIRHSWHGDDGDENDNSMQIATFWNLFSLEPNTWSAESSSSEIGQEVLVDDNDKDVIASPTNLTAKVQTIFESFTKMSETNININKKQFMSNMDKVFETIKTKFEPFAEGEIPIESRSSYWNNNSDGTSKEACEMGKLGSSTPIKKHSVITSNNTNSTPTQWPQTKVYPKVMLVKKFLKSIPPVNKRSKHIAPILSSTSGNNKFKVLSTTQEMKQNAVRDFERELRDIYSNEKIGTEEYCMQVLLTEELEKKYSQLLKLSEDNYISKVFKVLNKYGEPVMLFLTRRLLIMYNVNTENYKSLVLKDMDNIVVGEHTVSFDCKGAANMTVISSIDIDAVSTLISNVEIMCLKQHYTPSSVSAKQRHTLMRLLEHISSQTQYFNKNGILTVKEAPNSPKNISVIQCHSFSQVYDKSRPYTFKVNFNPYSFVLFAAPDESQLFDWLQDIMISIKINDDKTHNGSSQTPEENISGNYLLVSPSHIVCYKYPHHVNLVVPLQQISAFKLSKTCDYCVMELNCLEASEDELLNDVAFHFISKSKLEQFSNALLSLRYFQVSDDLLLHEQMLNSTNKKIKSQWEKCLQ
ncbi:hypothetical protein M8J77_006723 [Diaphorina citri]|nr:hypothetical protein M8J77_006723 [Diaphorina citri]